MSIDYNLKDLMQWHEKIEKIVNKVGLDYYPQEYEIVGYNDMLAYESYVGKPSRYPHGVMVSHMKKTKLCIN